MRGSSPLIACILASSLVLGACSDNAAPEASSAAADGDTGEEIALADLPTQRAGVWRTTVTVNGEPQEPIRECIAADQPILDEDAGLAGCSPAIHRLPGGFRLEGRCRTEAGSGHVRADITGDFQRRVRVNMQTSQALPQQDPVVLNFRMESVYEGPCAPGQEPGQIDE
jgi:hypothetical protein